MKKSYWILLIIFALGLSSLACNFSFGRTATPEADFPLTTEVLAPPMGNPAEPNPEAENQSTAPITVNENQLQALIVEELQPRLGDQITNLEVYLRSGQIQISGDVNTQGISAPVNVVVAVSVDPVGRPSLNIISSNIGPFPVPGDLIDEVEALINNAFREKIDSLAPNMHIDQIVIQNGVMAIYGHSN